MKLFKRRKPEWDGRHRCIRFVSTYTHYFEEEWHWKCACGVTDMQMDEQSAIDSFLVHQVRREVVGL